MDKIINVRHLQRKGTEAEWNSESAVKLLNGELGYATDTKILKMGDGEHLWKDLPSIANLVEVDEKTISKNDEDKIQSIGVMEKNKNTPSYDWVGTEKEYNALGTYNNDWTYFITDDYTEAGGGNGATTIDNTTITKNTAGDIQTVAVKEKNSSIAIYDWVGTEKEYLALSEYHDDWKYYITDDYFDSTLSVHNPGDIFFTIRTDSLPGAVDANGGEYAIEDYSGEKAVGKLLESGALPYVSKTEFANLVSENGYCEKFGWNGASDTTFLVPNVRTWSTKNIIPVAGNGLSLGLSNGTDNIGAFTGQQGNMYGRKAGYADPVGSNPSSYDLTVTDKSLGITTDASKSGIVADASTRSTLRVMVQLVTAVADEALENYSSLKSDVATLKTEIVEKEDTANKVTKITSSSTDSQYPSAKAVMNYVNGSAASGSGGVPVGATFTTNRTGLIGGAVEANGGEYNISDYSGEASIGTLLSQGDVAYVSKTEFQTQVANTGACGSFGWNGAGKTLYAWANKKQPSTLIYTDTQNPTTSSELFEANGTNITDSEWIIDVASDYSEIQTQDERSHDYTYSRDSANDIAGTDPTFLVPKLPMRTIVKKQKPTADNHYTWYNLYSDGWVEQGGAVSQEGSAIVTLPITMSDTKYTVALGNRSGQYEQVLVENFTTTSFKVRNANSGGEANCCWEVSGYTSTTVTTPERTMVQLATGATDEALETCTSVLSDVSALKEHRVIEFMEPTSTNNYTWYRKYADGWVEQGGTYTVSADAAVTITMPIEMADTNYIVFKNVVFTTETTVDNINSRWGEFFAKTTTTFGTWGKYASSIAFDWKVEGMAA